MSKIKSKVSSMTQVARKKTSSSRASKAAAKRRHRGVVAKYVPVEAEPRAFDGTLRELVPMMAHIDDYVGEALFGEVFKNLLVH